MRALGGAVGAVLLAAVAAFAATPPSGKAAPPAATGPAQRPVDDQTVHEVAAQLRCVVCQALSVADSPSETASQMRAVIRERLAAGETPEQVRAYFVEKYGDWILLSPPKSGFNLLVWVLPFVGVGIGLVLIWRSVRRWSRAAPSTAAPTMDPAVRERIRREMADMDRQ